MSWRRIMFFVKHEWRALTRRNMAGILTGLVPIAVAPVIGLMCSSMVQTLRELGDYGHSIESYVLIGGLGSLSFFPVLYGIFLASDVIVLETELGTIELILWSPVREGELLMGKTLVPFLLTVCSGAGIYFLYTISYILGARLVGLRVSPWPLVLFMFTALLALLFLSILLGITVSSFATNTKAAATLSLSIGGLVMLAEGGIGIFLTAIGAVPQIIVAVYLLGNLVASTIAFAAVVKRFGHREFYFLRNSGRTSHD